MQKSILIAGFGGQGVMALGKLLAITAASTEGVHVTYFPAYGVEQRGGTANCHIVIADRRIGSPISDKMHELIAMNDMSLTRFVPDLQISGLLLINSDVVTREPERTDVRVVKVAANREVARLKNPKGANIVMLGAYIGCTGVLPEQNVLDTLRKELGTKKPELAPRNEAAFLRGLELGIVAKGGVSK